VEGLLSIDLEDRIIMMNQASARLLNTRQDTAVGKTIQEVIRNPEIQKLIKDAATTHEPMEKEVVFRNGAEKLFQVHLSGLFADDGARMGTLLVFSDVTRVRTLENHRRDFVANVSHELRTPLTSIKGFVETLLDGDGKDRDQDRRFLEIVRRH